jgi:hypothetical protein
MALTHSRACLLRGSRPIGQPLANRSDQCTIRALDIIASQLDPVVVAEIKLSHVAVKVTLAAMLIDAGHAALEDGEVAFNRVRVDIAPGIFLFAVFDGVMSREFSAKGPIQAALIRQQATFPADIGEHDRRDIGHGGTLDMERAHHAAALDQAQNSPLVAVARLGLLPAFLGADIGLIRLYGLAGAAHWFNPDGFHRLADAMGEEPCGFHAAAECALELAGADPLLAAAHQVDSLQPDAERDMAALEHSAHADRERLPARIALVKPGPGGLALQFPDARCFAAMVADRAVGPQLALDIGERGFLVVEMRLGYRGFHHTCTPSLRWAKDRCRWMVCQV